MFISQINHTIIFNEKTWLVSITDRSDEDQRKIPGARVFIEGVLQHRLVFIRYDMSALPWQVGQKRNPDYVGYLANIENFETCCDKELPMYTQSRTYLGSPTLCNILEKYFQHIRHILNTKMIIANNTPPETILIKTNTMDWCIHLFRQLKRRYINVVTSEDTCVQ